MGTMAGVPRWQARAGGWLPCQQAANYTSCSLVWLVLVSEVSASTCGVMRWRLAALGASSGGAKSSHGPGLGGEVGLGAGQPPGRVEGGGDEQGRGRGDEQPDNQPDQTHDVLPVVALLALPGAWLAEVTV